MKRPLMEGLEPRVLLDAVAWTGLGDGSRWDDPANWNVNRLPGATDDVTIAVTDADPLIRFGLDGATHTVQSLASSETLQVEGGELRLTGLASFSAALLLKDGAIGGGVWEAEAGVTQPIGRWLSHLAGPIEVRGDIAIPEYGQVAVTGGLHLLGTLTIESSGHLYFDGPQAITSGTFHFLPTDGYNREIVFRDDTGGTLELGEGVTISGGAQDVAFLKMAGSQPLTIINRGTIRSEGEFNRIHILGRRFENHGTLDAVGGSVLWVAAADFENMATMSATGATLTIGYNSPWANSGLITVEDSTLVLDGIFTPIDIAPERLSRTGGRLEIAGELHNQGNTLVLDANAGTWWINEGAVIGGEIDIREPARLVSAGTDSTYPDRLVGPITVHGLLEVEGFLRVDGDLTLDGEMRLLGGYDGGRLHFAVSGGIYGGVIRASSPGYTNYISLISSQAIDVVLGGGVRIIGESQVRLTISRSVASSVRLDGTLEVHDSFQLYEYQKLLSFINEGTIDVRPGAEARIHTAEFRNEGVVIVSGSVRFESIWSSPGLIDVQGGTWTLDGLTTTEGSGLRRVTRDGGQVELVGRLDNTGELLVLDAVTGPLAVRGGDITGGVVEMRDGLTLRVDTVDSRSELDGVEIRGDIEQTGSWGFRVRNGLTVLGKMSVYGSIQFTESQSVRVTLMEVTAGTFWINYWAPNGGDLVFDEGSTLRVAPGAGSCDIRVTGSGEFAFRNRGLIEVFGTQFRNDFEDGVFINEGTVSLHDDAYIWIEVPGDVDDQSTLVRGTWRVADQATLEFRNQEIIAIGADAEIVKTSAQGVIDGLMPGLNRVDGAFRLSNGAWIECWPIGGVLSLGGRLIVEGAGSFFEVNGDMFVGASGEIGLVLDGGTAPVRVTGTATLGGRLAVELAAGFVLGDGEAAALLDAGSIEGAFGEVAMPQAATGNKHALRTTGGLMEMLHTDLADANLDGVVDTRDIMQFLGWWASGDGGADANGDGVIDSRDILLFLSWWADG